jgi:hypothetical protein
MTWPGFNVRRSARTRLIDGIYKKIAMQHCSIYFLSNGWYDSSVANCSLFQAICEHVGVGKVLLIVKRFKLAYLAVCR